MPASLLEVETLKRNEEKQIYLLQQRKQQLQLALQQQQKQQQLQQ